MPRSVADRGDLLVEKSMLTCAGNTAKWKKRHVGDIAAYGSGIRVHHSPAARDLWSWLSFRI